MKDQILTISSVKKLQNDIFKMVLAGDCSEITAPGQFVNIKLDGFFLRRPISIADYTESSLTIIYKTVGKGTKFMASLPVGKTLQVLMPLGNGFDLNKIESQLNYSKDESARLNHISSEGVNPILKDEIPFKGNKNHLEKKNPLVLIGGGIGLPPMLSLSKALLKKGIIPTVIAGFNSQNDVILEQEFNTMGISPIVTTVDGSYGAKGLVTEPLADILATQPDAYVCTCGPEPMLKAIHESASQGQFSFEARMACGFGACMGCTCKTKYGSKRICTDGPVLERDEIIW